jgi:hypothetical protein
MAETAPEITAGKGSGEPRKSWASRAEPPQAATPNVPTAEMLPRRLPRSTWPALSVEKRGVGERKAVILKPSNTSITG